MAEISPRAVVLAILFFLILYVPPTQNRNLSAPVEKINARIEETWDAVRILNTTSFGDFAPWLHQNDSQDDTSIAVGYLNLTGFRRPDQFSWSLMPVVQTRFRTILDHILGNRGTSAIEQSLFQDFLQYGNTSSSLRGVWTRSASEPQHLPAPLNLSAIATDVSWAPGAWQRNITGQTGEIWVKLDEPTPPTDFEVTEIEHASARPVTAAVSIQDETSIATGWSFAMRGIHFLGTGTTVLSSGSAKYSGTFALPHFLLTQSQYAAAQRSLNSTFPRIILQREKEMRESQDGGITEIETPQCELIMYLQQEPISGSDRGSIDALEKTLRFPAARLFYHQPELRMQSVMFSPDCGFLLESRGPPDFTGTNHISGPLIPAFVSNNRHAVEAVIAVFMIEVAILLRQMKVTDTPSKQSRISISMLMMMTLSDSLAWITLLVAAPIYLELNIVLLAASFAAFLASSLFPMRFLMDVFNAQEPERLDAIRDQERRNAELAASAQALTPNTSTDATDNPTRPSRTRPDNQQGQTLPPPVTAARFVDTGASPIAIPATNTANPPPQTGTTITLTTPRSQRGGTFGSLYARMTIMTIVMLLALVYAITSFSAGVLSLFFRTLSLAYCSFWLPQIIRNITRNTSRALLPSFIIGQSLIRLTPFVYIWAYPDNVLYVRQDKFWLCILAGWLWIQNCMLAAQYVLGPRFCVTEHGKAGRFWKWLGVKDTWNWHPVLREDEEGGTLPVGSSFSSTSTPTSPIEERGRKSIDDTSMREGLLGSNTRKNDSKGKRTYECAICMQTLQVPILPLGENESIAGNAIGLLDRRKYMVTPCRHIFHTGCLEAWAAMRLQCPICRETLPPV